MSKALSASGKNTKHRNRKKERFGSRVDEYKIHERDKDTTDTEYIWTMQHRSSSERSGRKILI